jgi:hypothetical protein
MACNAELLRSQKPWLKLSLAEPSYNDVLYTEVIGINVVFMRRGEGDGKFGSTERIILFSSVHNGAPVTQIAPTALL